MTTRVRKEKKGRKTKRRRKREVKKEKRKEESRQTRVRHTDNVGCIYRRKSSTYVSRGCSSGLRHPALSKVWTLSLVFLPSPARGSPAKSIKAASFEGEIVAKKGLGNTASNRVNCAAYAFISLFRDNLLIVSTKRDKPPCTRVQAGFSVTSHTGHASCRPRRDAAPAKRINLYAGEGFDTRFLSLGPLDSLFCTLCNVCTTMVAGAVPSEQQPSEELAINQETRSKSRYCDVCRVKYVVVYRNCLFNWRSVNWKVVRVKDGIMEVSDR